MTGSPNDTQYALFLFSPPQLVETYLGKPGLVRETSRVGMLTSSMRIFRRSVALMADLLGEKGGEKSTRDGWLERGLSGRARAVRAFFDVVLSPDLKEQVRQVPERGSYGRLA